MIDSSAAMYLFQLFNDVLNVTLLRDIELIKILLLCILYHHTTCSEVI